MVDVIIKITKKSDFQMTTSYLSYGCVCRTVLALRGRLLSLSRTSPSHRALSFFTQWILSILSKKGMRKDGEQQCHGLYSATQVSLRLSNLPPDGKSPIEFATATATATANSGCRAYLSAIYFQFLFATILACPAIAQEPPTELLRLANEASALFNAGKFSQALPLNRAALQMAERSAVTDHVTITTLRENLAWNLLLLAKDQVKRRESTAAVPIYQEAINLLDKVGDKNIDTALASFAKLQFDLGNVEQALILNLRALGLREASAGLVHPSLVGILAVLGHSYLKLNQFVRAQQFFERALAINTRAFGPDDVRLAHLVGALGQVQLNQGRLDQAAELFARALSLHEKADSPDSEDVASLVSNLGSVYAYQRKYAQAESQFSRALGMLEGLLGREHPQVAAILNNFALLKFSQKQFKQAEIMWMRVIATRELTLGASHPLVASALANMAGLHEAQGDMTQALVFMRKSSRIHRRRLIDGAASAVSLREAQLHRAQFSAHLSMLTQPGVTEDAAALVDESFQVAQLAQASGTSVAIARMASRFSSGNGAIAAFVKRKQDALEHAAKTEDALLTALSQPNIQRDLIAEQTLRSRISQLTATIQEVDAEMIARFPEYQELTRSEPISVQQVQALLRPDEAMVTYSLDEARSWMWVLRKSTAVFIPLRSTPDYFTRIVQQVRAGMDFDAAGNPREADLNALRSIYLAAFAPALAHLKDVNHVMLVPSGALQSLPFGMLIASPLAAGNLTAYDTVDWLARHRAMSVLPSASSIRAFRQFVKPMVTGKRYIGFGDPLLTDARTGIRGSARNVDASGVYGAVRSGRTQSSASQPEIADVAFIKRQIRLPETADEIRAMAKIMRSDEGDIWLQAKATESNVKRLNLSVYGVIAFATHGVMAGELRAGMEPGLILTPPEQGSAQDDGYLSAGEIAQLKLNADLVLLSACNTAASDGQPGAESLSGLAKAFFYAGSRSLLVSHWPVASEAVVPLTTTMLNEYAAAPAIGKAKAHQKAMLALMNTPGHPEYAHPLFWAPFVVVGEGGSAAPE